MRGLIQKKRSACNPPVVRLSVERAIDGYDAFVLSVSSFIHCSMTKRNLLFLKTKGEELL
ncbi:hypothetical protein DSCOOX_10010 [Desulfosarcina ovata subsp. ovata]|uniref:Uncharacterized protein n=2 Tax=Desulfosarcina ovata TaxID=83564 RepID=A0A5K8A5T6_9BACT|nr:hypothetical protein DSCOOX_10010 [Desulfosarcina ovata subsp. ovata]